jgi:hypothetical protein
MEGERGPTLEHATSHALRDLGIEYRLRDLRRLATRKAASVVRSGS